MDDVGLGFAGDLLDAFSKLSHQRHFAKDRQRCQESRSGFGPVEAQAVNIFEWSADLALLGGGEMEGFPAQGPLFPEQRSGTEGVAAVQRNGVVEDVEDAHHPAFLRQDNQKPCQARSF